MESLNFPGPDRLYQISYDEFGDVLYVKSEASRLARKSIAEDDGFLWRLGTVEGQPAGFTVMDFNHNWQHRMRQFAERISVGMSWDANAAKKLASAIVTATKGRTRIGDDIFAGLPADRPVTPRGAR